jgi:hypothetical protein
MGEHQPRGSLARTQFHHEIAIERLGDAQERVDARWAPAALEPCDRRLRRGDGVRQLGLGQAELTPALRHALRDLGKEPAILGVREPLPNAFEGLVGPVRDLTHISITLYIAVMRYMIAVAAEFVTLAVNRRSPAPG